MDKPKEAGEKRDKLIELIKVSKMPKIEKEAWLKMTEEMLEHEIEEFIKILQEEEGALKVIEAKYQEKIKKIKDEFNQRWSEVIEKAEKQLDEKTRQSLESSEKQELEKLRKQLK